MMNSLNNKDEHFDDKPLFFDLHEETNIFNTETNEDPVLTKMVREAYYQHIKSILRNNMSQTGSDVSEEILNNHAKEIELYALRACMSSSLYRHVMLHEINYIKYLTYVNIAVFEKQTINTNMNNEENNCKSDSVNPEQFEFEERSSLSERLRRERLDIYFNKFTEDKSDKDNTLSINSDILPVVKSEPCSDDSVPEKYEPDINIDPEHLRTTDTLYDKVYEEMSKIFETENISTEVDSTAVPETTHISQKEVNLPVDKVTQMCKKRITWHVRNCLSVYFKKNYFRSADEFRILAKNIVSRLLQINPCIDYKHIYRAISKVFDKKTGKVSDVTQIHKIVSQVAKYVVGHDNSVL